jgi:pyruvate,water dikinase
MSGGLIAKILSFLPGIEKSTGSREDLDKLQAEFKLRYQAFKILLSANNKALEVMAELDESQNGKRAVSNGFLKTRCTQASVSVLQMVRQLDILAPGKYPELEIRFREIESRLREILDEGRHEQEAPLVLDLRDVRSSNPLATGGKAANLSKLIRGLDVKIPSGFTATSSAFDLLLRYNGITSRIESLLQYLHENIADRMNEVQPEIESLILNSEIPPELETAISEKIRIMADSNPDIKFAVRSSAVGEDSMQASFAGQFRSLLDISPDRIMEAYRKVLAGKYSARALQYALSRGIPDDENGMCVCFLEMIDSVSGGVVYTRDPADHENNNIVIDSVFGLAKNVVDGTEKNDRFIISRGSCEILKEETADPHNGASINADQAKRIASTALKIETFFDYPQDIEWTFNQQDQLIILQSRPLRHAVRRNRNTEIKIDTEPVITGGVTASPGAAGGPVHILRSKATTLNIPEGCILVVTRAFPRYAPLLRRVSGLISEKGGITGHLANVAREYGIPAIMGMENATGFLAAGDIVTMDAENRAVYPGIEEKLLKNTKNNVHRQQQSPLSDKFKKASKLITPLNLTDPESREFSAAGCRTLHDLTRYIHEVSVRHMFSSGSSEQSALRAAKQIVADRPLKWWVVNLDDGFASEIKGKYVGLAQIRCEPMTALWDGMMAVPWAGPPPVNARGFMSILVEASANPHLDPAVVSPHSFKNYFMISKNFCLLHTRFGFHFSVAEALVGDNPAENYISFKFRGGAADYERKRRRVEFIKSVLSYYGFRTRLRGENCFSRLTGQEKAYMLRALRALGYIIIHTRQMDMVMCDQECVSNYREQFIRDIDEIVSRGQDEPGFGSFFLEGKGESGD